MAHVGEEAVLGLVEHVDLLTLLLGGYELLVKSELRIGHYDSHDELENCEDQEVGHKVRFYGAYGDCIVKERDYRDIGCQRNGEIYQRIEIYAERDNQGNRHEERCINGVSCHEVDDHERYYPDV